MEKVISVNNTSDDEALFDTKNTDLTIINSKNPKNKPQLARSSMKVHPIVMHPDEMDKLFGSRVKITKVSNIPYKAFLPTLPEMPALDLPKINNKNKSSITLKYEDDPIPIKRQKLDLSLNSAKKILANNNNPDELCKRGQPIVRSVSLSNKNKLQSINEDETDKPTIFTRYAQ
jgi:hypothetical protein